MDLPGFKQFLKEGMNDPQRRTEILKAITEVAYEGTPPAPGTPAAPLPPPNPTRSVSVAGDPSAPLVPNTDPEEVEREKARKVLGDSIREVIGLCQGGYSPMMVANILKERNKTDLDDEAVFMIHYLVTQQADFSDIVEKVEAKAAEKAAKDIGTK